MYAYIYASWNKKAHQSNIISNELKKEVGMHM